MTDDDTKEARKSCLSNFLKQRATSHRDALTNELGEQLAKLRLGGAFDAGAQTEASNAPIAPRRHKKRRRQYKAAMPVLVKLLQDKRFAALIHKQQLDELNIELRKTDRTLAVGNTLFYELLKDAKAFIQPATNEDG